MAEMGGLGERCTQCDRELRPGEWLVCTACAEAQEIMARKMRLAVEAATNTGKRKGVI